MGCQNFLLPPSAFFPSNSGGQGDKRKRGHQKLRYLPLLMEIKFQYLEILFFYNVNSIETNLIGDF